MTVEIFEFDQPNGGSDPVNSAMYQSGITAPTPRYTPLMLDASGAVVAWDGTKAGGAVALLALDTDGTQARVCCFKSGTWRVEDIAWPDGVSDVLMQNAFAGTALSIV
jgi:hypothetical protein